MTLDNCETAQLGRRERMGESNEIAAHSIKVGVERREGKRGKSNLDNVTDTKQMAN